jgi:hypothetical protein
MTWHTSDNVFVQQLTPSGAPVWSVNGVEVASSAGNFRYYPEVVSDESGGAIVTWEEEDPLEGDFHVFAQRIGAAGAKLWGADGAGIFTGTGGSGFPQIARDGLGGAIITWGQTYSGSLDIYAQRLDGDGVAIWGNTIAVCGLVASDQSSPEIVDDAYGRAIVIWRDERDSPSGDLYCGTAPETVVIEFTDDNVYGSLRDAIETHNFLSKPFAVNFDLFGAGPHDFELNDPLPAITVPVLIDGYSQPGSSPNTNPPGQPFNGWVPIVLLNEPTYSGAGIVLMGGNSVVRGVAVNGFVDGIRIYSDDNIVEGCFVGLHPTGTAPHANHFNGILVTHERNRIGGTHPSQRNLISGNGSGVLLDNSVFVCNDNRLLGNWIGTDVSGQYDVGNFYAGVFVAGNDNVVGGRTPEEANIIAHTARDGVVIANGSGHRVSGNSIYSNDWLGIDLYAGGSGVTPNDAGDADSGPNGLLNFPVLTSAASDGSTLTVIGQSDGAASIDLDIEFFSSTACDGSGNGEGAAYLGSATVNTGSGTAPFSVVLPVAVALGSWVTATATDAAGNTSEFSICVPVANTPPGANVVVDLVYGDFTASLTFDNVTTPGNTTLEVAAGCPGLPGSFIIPSAVCYNLTTTAVFSGSVDVCFSYDDTVIPGNESNVRLVHYDTTLDPPDWVDITTTLDTGAHVVCGETTSLSPFATGIGSVTAADPDRPLPTEFALHQNVPNPFNPATVVAYDVPVGGAHMSIRIYDVAGRLVRTLVDSRQPAGRYTVSWRGEDSNGQTAASGVYFCRMEAGAFTETRKMVLLK